LPARIQLDPRELQQHPLRIGLSMDVEVETRDESGTQLAAATNTSYRTDVFEQYGAQADAEIAKVIADNIPIAAPRTLAKRDQAQLHRAG
jgi:membrane fusion protein (multidrug efflux system)